MSIFKILSSNFRVWWQRPRSRKEEDGHRQVSFLELFYDLVYVVLIAQLAHALGSHLSLDYLFRYAFLFILVWWAWFNGTSYHDLHGNNDVRTRIFTFLQMFTVVAMGIFIHDAMGSASKGFALSFAAFQLILSWLWWRTGYYEKEHRVLSTPYSLVSLTVTTLFVISVFVSEDIRITLWIIALVFSLLTPLMMMFLASRNENAREQMDNASLISHSYVERFGLFTIIVIGEIVVSIVSSGMRQEGNLETVGTILLGTSVAVVIWWVYFDLISHRLPKNDLRSFGGWLYLHIPVTMAIVTVGAVLPAILNTQGTIPELVLWIFLGSMSVILLSVYLLSFMIEIEEDNKQVYRVARIILPISAVLIFSIGFLELHRALYLSIPVVLFFMPILIGVTIWVKTRVGKVNSEQ